MIDDAARKRVKERITSTKRAIQQGIIEHHEAIRRQLMEDRERISEDRRRSENNNREAESNIGKIQQIISEYSSEFERRADRELEKRINTFEAVIRGIRGWLEKARKSIEGVKNELEKMKLFEEAREKIVSIRQKINLSPRR